MTTLVDEREAREARETECSQRCLADEPGQVCGFYRNCALRYGEDQQDISRSERRCQRCRLCPEACARWAALTESEDDRWRRRGHAEDQLIGRGASEGERRDRLAETLEHSLLARVAADLLLEKLETPGELGHDSGQREHGEPRERGADDEDPLRQHGAS